MFTFFKNYKNYLDFFKIPLNKKNIVIYSEGRNYWPYLKEITYGFINFTNKSVFYISSDQFDPGLYLTHSNFKSFCIGDGVIKNLFFNTLSCEMIIMTMPDIGNFHLKKMENGTHYVYLHHSLVSHHMAYRPNAFNNYDTIICFSKNHIKELEIMEKFYNTKVKNKISSSYPLFNYLKVSNSKTKNKSKQRKVLVAPSWGRNGLIETEAAIELIYNLILGGSHVVLRPHPETYKKDKNKINKIKNKFKDDKNFILEKDICNYDNLYNSDVLITDWSGIAFDFALGLNKPVVFTNSKPKINNKSYKDIGIKPLEMQCRDFIGKVVDLEKIPNFIISGKYKKIIVEKKFIELFSNNTNSVVKSLLKL